MLYFFLQHLSVTHAGVNLKNAYCVRNICRALCYALGTRGGQNHVVIGYKDLVRGCRVYAGWVRSNRMGRREWSYGGLHLTTLRLQGQQLMMVCQSVGDRTHPGIHCRDGGTEAWASVGLHRRSICEHLVTDWMWEVRVSRHAGLSTSDS